MRAPAQTMRALPPSLTMTCGRLPDCRCRHGNALAGLERPSGRNSARAITSSTITSPAPQRPRTEISLGARAHTTTNRLWPYAHALGIDVGAAETEAFWSEVARSLVARGLSGVQLVVSDAHEGLKRAIAKVLGCPLAALHRALPQGLPRPRPPRPARPARRADPTDLPGRVGRPSLRTFGWMSIAALFSSATGSAGPKLPSP
jgi:Transposase, Mutator family